jgi:hypothetical protein
MNDFLGEVAPQGRKRANTGFTQTTFGGITAEPEILRRVLHPITIQAHCCLTSVFKWEHLYQTWKLSWLRLMNVVYVSIKNMRILHPVNSLVVTRSLCKILLNKIFIFSKKNPKLLNIPNLY